MRFLPFVILLSPLVGTPACLEANRATVVSSDSSAGDTSVADTSPADTTPPPCGLPSDCTALTAGPCDQVRCVDQECRLVPRADSFGCDDGDVCTTGDRCLAGDCVGQPRECDATEPCLEGACIAGSGCVYRPIAAGAPCDDEVAPGVGDCHGAEIYEGDVCDGQGSCTTQSVSGEPAGATLNGQWVAVVTSVSALLPGTALAQLQLARDGTLLADEIRHSEADTAEDEEGAFCASKSGTIRVDLPLVSYAGRVAISDDLLIIHSELGNQVGAAVRTGVVAEVVDGEYVFIGSSDCVVGGGATLNTPRSWVGDIIFESGCMEGSGQAWSAENVPDTFTLEPKEEACFTSAGGSLNRFSYTVTGTAGDRDVTLVGGIGAGGDVLVFACEAPDTHVAYGTVVMVRWTDDDVVLQKSRWSFLFNGHNAVGLPRGERGVIGVDGAGGITDGYVEPFSGTRKEVTAGWLHLSEAGRASMRRVVGLNHESYAGWTTPTGELFVGVQVTNVLGLQPEELDPVPVRPSLLLMLRDPAD